MSDPAGREPFRILVVCTANICRSVMAQAFLEREVAARGLDVTVGSCGIRFDGEPASETVIGVLAERSLDVTPTVLAISPPSCWPRRISSSPWSGCRPGK